MSNEPQYNYDDLNRQMDKVKSKVFLGKSAAFFGSLLCSLEFKWDTSIPTAATDGVSIWWNPNFFMKIMEETNKTILCHELEHAARLHNVRRGGRDAQTWNEACDIRINNGLQKEGYSFKGVEDCWMEQSLDDNGLMAEEDIYDILIKRNKPQNKGAWGDKAGSGDMIEPKGIDVSHAVSNVVRAVQQAKVSGASGSIPGGVEELINKFMEPVVPWQTILMDLFTDLLDEEYTWARPNRRYPDMYLPSRFEDDGRLSHIMYFLDVSASVSDAQVLRFNSEIKYIQDTLQPTKLTMVLFDTKIQSVRVFDKDEPFGEIHITGRGGTSLACVRALIEKEQPSAVVIFSDLYCTPMEPLTTNIPVIWAVIGSQIQGPYGKTIFVKC